MRAQMLGVALRGTRTGGVFTSVPNATITSAVNFPASALASITFESDGSLTIVGDSADPATRWLTGSTNGAAYDLVVMIGDEAFSAGSAATATPLQLNSDRLFKVVRSSLGTKFCTASYQIYATGTVTPALSTGSITLTAQVA